MTGSPVPAMDLWAQVGLWGFMGLMVVAIFVYHAVMARSAGRRRALRGGRESADEATASRTRPRADRAGAVAGRDADRR